MVYNAFSLESITPAPRLTDTLPLDDGMSRLTLVTLVPRDARQTRAHTPGATLPGHRALQVTPT